MANLTNETLSKANGSVPEYKNKNNNLQLEKLSHDAGEKIGSMASKFANSTTEYVKAGQSYVKENPTKGIAIAVAGGVLVGSLLTLLLSRRD